MKRGFLTLLVLGCAGCASITGTKTPDLYPNERLTRSSPGESQAAVSQCMALGDQYSQQPNRYQDLLKQGLVGGAIGAGTGAVAGAITGNAGRGTGAGAAVGGILGVLKSLSETNDHSPSYERFVERCLQKQGYEVVGWSAKPSNTY